MDNSAQYFHQVYRRAFQLTCVWHLEPENTQVASYVYDMWLILLKLLQFCIALFQGPDFVLSPTLSIKGANYNVNTVCLGMPQTTGEFLLRFLSLKNVFFSRCPVGHSSEIYFLWLTLSIHEIGEFSSNLALFCGFSQGGFIWVLPAVTKVL